MKCPYCNTENPDGQKFCGNCGKPIMDSQPQQSNWIDDRQQVQRMPKFYELTWVIILACIFIPPLGIIFLWMSKRPKSGIARVLLTVFLGAYSLPWLAGVVVSTENKTESSAEESSVEESTEEGSKEQEESKSEKTTKFTPEELKSDCEEFNYKDVMRNPDNYIGKKFKVTAEISTVSDSWGAKYYKVYDDADGSGYYFSNMMYMIDKRSEEDDGYIRLLEGDIVTFYGEFTGLSGSENSITGEKSEEMSLDVYYAELVSE